MYNKKYVENRLTTKGALLYYALISAESRKIKGEKQMKRKLMVQLSAVALAVCATVILVACGGVSAGFSSQEALAKAYVSAMSKSNLSDYGEGMTLSEVAKFAYEANSIGTLLGIGDNAFNDLTKMAKDVHKAKMNGNWVLDYNEDGSAETKIKPEDVEKYKNAYNAVKNQAKSFKYVSIEKDDAKTATLAAATTESLATNVGVWKVTYEFTPYNAENVAQTKMTDQTIDLQMQKIGGKWYLTNTSMMVLAPSILAGIPFDLTSIL